MDIKQFNELKDEMGETLINMRAIFKEQANTKLRIDELKKDIVVKEKSMDVLTSFINMLKDIHINSIATVINETIYPVFGRLIRFDVDMTKPNMEVVLEVSTDHGETWMDELLENSGYGMIDLISFIIRVALISKCGMHKVLIMDEPFKNIDDTRLETFINVLEECHKTFGVQMIFITHSQALLEWVGSIENGSVINSANWNNS